MFALNIFSVKPRKCCIVMSAISDSYAKMEIEDTTGHTYRDVRREQTPVLVNKKKPDSQKISKIYKDSQRLKPKY